MSNQKNQPAQALQMFTTIVATLRSLGGNGKEIMKLLSDGGDELAKAIAITIMSWQEEYVIPLRDEDVPERYQATLAIWRQWAKTLGYFDSVAWLVRGGFTLKKHAWKYGPLNVGKDGDWGSVHCIRFADDPTVPSLAFWIPKVLSGSNNMTRAEQLEFLRMMNDHMGLPAAHLSLSFGSAALLTGLIFAHYKRTGERAPHEQWIATSTRHGKYGSLYIRFLDSGWPLQVIPQHDRAGKAPYMSVFALGEERLSDEEVALLRLKPAPEDYRGEVSKRLLDQRK